MGSDEKPVGVARQASGKMIRDPFIQPQAKRETVRGCEIDPTICVTHE
jgi:hypothetical protein